LAVALAATTVVSALMPTFELTMAARFLAGLPHGAYFGVASLLAASLMGPGSQGKGVAVALSGLTFANLAGVPLMTALGQVAGWRTVYLVIAGIFAATVLALRWAVPAQPVVPGRRAVDELLALRRVQLWVVMGIAAVGFAGGFAVFSYVADITTRVSGASAGMVPWVLAAAGLGMTLGNVLGGMTTDRSLRGTLLLGFPVYIAALVGLFLAAPGSLAGLIIGLFAVNAANAVLNPALQHWLIRVAHRAEVLGASLNHAACNVANALGAALGGAVIAGGLGFRAPMVVAILLASTGLVLVLTTLAALRVRSRRTLAVLREHERTYTGPIPVISQDDESEETAEPETTSGRVPVRAGACAADPAPGPCAGCRARRHTRSRTPGLGAAGAYGGRGHRPEHHRPEERGAAVHIQTAAVHALRDFEHGAEVPPVHLASTVELDPATEDRPYHYQHGSNPTRAQLETVLAALDDAEHGFAFASGMAATAAALSTLTVGDEVLLPASVYGGTYRFVDLVLPGRGITGRFVDDLGALTDADFTPSTRAVFVETPANPTLRITDLRRIIEL